VVRVALFISLGIELLQLLQQPLGVARTADVDDVMLNVLGAVLGALLGKALTRAFAAR
jgi:glycopeptide antibiotics resistance protein